MNVSRTKRDLKKRRTGGLAKLFSHAPDKGLLLFSVIMMVFGLIMIFDASVYVANQNFNDQFYFLKLQLVWILIGLGPAIFLYFFDYRKLTKLAVPALAVVIALLIGVLIFGNEIYGAKRWFAIGPLPIQPAEFAKPVVILYLASWLAKERKTYKTFGEAFRHDFLSKLARFIAILGAILLLVVLEPDLGTTVIIAVTAFAMFFISGSDFAHTVGSIGVFILMTLMGVLAAVLAPYRFERVKTFLHLLFKGEVDDPRGSGYQIQQILIGIGSSGFWGKGFGQSRQRFGYLVENTAFTDSIFAVVLEELGFIGGIIMVLFWMVFLWKGLQISQRAPDRQGQLIAAGITIWLAIQAFMNMAANVGLVPLTGIPLPFLTYGGSNTVVTMAAIAILLNISRFTTPSAKENR
jgi:cell division protein FtsW